MATPADAYRHLCSARISVLCTRGNGKPKRKACAYCGSRFTVEQGLYGVFAWRGDGRYRRGSAIRLFRNEVKAEAWARGESPEYVVRFV